MKKNILLLGSGGREHAIAHSIRSSDLLAQLFIMPGNPGTQDYAIQLPGNPADPIKLLEYIRQFEIDIVICGPEVPLSEGIMDTIQESNLQVKPILVGPGRAGAKLESSKAFSKSFMKKYGIPTASYMAFTKDQELEALEYIKVHSIPIVLKASGLAAGKGVIICEDHETAIQELKAMFAGKFGNSSETIVIEEFLRGIEFSVFILTNGSQFVLLPEAKDYKRIGEADTGPNTGGMGAVSPVYFFDDVLREKVRNRIIEPTLHGIREEGINYNGFIFFGLILVKGDPIVIEYNCRLGDPETEVILPRLKNDFIELLIAMEEQRLTDLIIETDARTAVTIMLVSKGYPDAYEKGKSISLPAILPGNSIIFHAGTKIDDYKLKTNGGRVLSVTSLAPSLQAALQDSLKLADDIHFDGKYYRRDIGLDLLS